MPQTMQLPEQKKRLAGKGLLIFFIITDVVAWTIVIWQNWTRISQFFHTYSSLFVLLTEIIISLLIAIVFIALFIWVFSTPYRFTQMRRSLPVLLLIIFCFGAAWLIHIVTYQPSSPSAIDTFGNTMTTFFIIIGLMVAIVAMVAAALVLFNRPDSIPQTIVIDYTNVGRGPSFANWIEGELKHENYKVLTKECQHVHLGDVLKEIRQEMMHGRLLILLLSPLHPLIQQCNWFSKFFLRFLHMYCHNICGKGTFLLLYPDGCPINKQEALSSFQPIDLNKGEEEAQQHIVVRVKAALKH